MRARNTGTEQLVLLALGVRQGGVVMIRLAVQYLDCTGPASAGATAVECVYPGVEHGVEYALIGSHLDLPTRAPQFELNRFGVNYRRRRKAFEANPVWIDSKLDRCRLDRVDQALRTTDVEYGIFRRIG